MTVNSWLLALLLFGAPPPEPVDPLDAQSLAAAEGALKARVATIRSTMGPRPDEASAQPEVVEGWGVVTGPREVRCQAFLVRGATQVRLLGPKGETTASILALDVELRVARLRSARPLEEFGLVPAVPHPRSERELDMDLIALVSTAPGSGVVIGVLTDLGNVPHLEGNLRSSLALVAGMPVFDTRLRWVGLSRSVAWDKDRQMLIPPELTRIPTSSTAGQKPSGPPPDEARERPWWAR